MYAALSVRRLKPGAFDDWRRAWEPEEWPEQLREAYILRRLDDPDEVIAFGFAEGSAEELSAWRNDPARQEAERARQERMAPHVDDVTTDGFYEVVEVVKPTAATS
jgi:hypothetical protein